MANALQREIKVGEHVVISQQIFVSQMNVHGRTFICETGFGMKPYLTGTKIIGRWADGSGNDVVPGDWIDVEETNTLAAEREKASAP